MGAVLSTSEQHDCSLRDSLQTMTETLQEIKDLLVNPREAEPREDEEPEHVEVRLETSTEEGSDEETGARSEGRNDTVSLTENGGGEGSGRISRINGVTHPTQVWVCGFGYPYCSQEESDETRRNCSLLPYIRMGEIGTVGIWSPKTRSVPEFVHWAVHGPHAPSCPGRRAKKLDLFF